MRLLEAMVDANQRAVRGDTQAGLHPDDFPDALPLVALTCIDARLNPLLPGALGLPAEQFIWLRNAGNIITGPLSSTMRSLALACAIKGGREIAVIGHTDCKVRQTPVLELMERFRALGVERAQLPDNLNEFFGLFASERQNVMRAAEVVRSSPLIGVKVPVHGLLLDLETGALEWLVNGYQALDTVAAKVISAVKGAAASVSLEGLSDFVMGEMKFPDTKIGEVHAAANQWLSEVQIPKPPPTEVNLIVEPPAPLPKYGSKPPSIKVKATGKPVGGKSGGAPPPLTSDLMQPWKTRKRGQ